MPNTLHSIFTDICNTDVTGFRDGRLILASHVIVLFEVDAAWASKHLLPLFDWRESEEEARAAWRGFLQSPRLYWPLIEAIKHHFSALIGITLILEEMALGTQLYSHWQRWNRLRHSLYQS